MRVPSTDGVELELHDLGGDGPPLLIAHATGFCARAYRPMAETLTPHHHVWALDFRAHGDSTRPTTGDLTWRGMADDVLAVVDAIGAGPVLGLGHSMGGAALAAAELRSPGTARALWLFEPIIIPPEWETTPGENPLAASARRRRPSFASHADALARYAHRPPLGVCRADALAAYVDAGFAEQPDGTVALKCRPEDEAATFEARGKPTIPTMAGVDAPTIVACGDRETIGPAAFAPQVAAAFPNGRLVRYPHVGHFGPFQDPTTLAEDAVAHFAEN
jgi:pimeloyl-ACP methyl ester carboxylesterase